MTYTILLVYLFLDYRRPESVYICMDVDKAWDKWCGARGVTRAKGDGPTTFYFQLSLFLNCDLTGVY